MGTAVLPGSKPFGEAMTRRYPDGLVPQGISTELIAAKWGFSRAEFDEFSAASHEKAARATKERLFDDELIPIAGLSADEILRPGTIVDSLEALKPPLSRRSTARLWRRGSRRSAGRSRRATPHRCPTAARR